MKSNDRLIKYVFLFLFISVFVFSGTFASYRNNISGDLNANVSIWSFKLDSQTESQINNIKMTDASKGSNLLPFSSGVLVFTFDTKGCETAVEYNIKFANMQNKPANLHFYTSSSFALADEISFGLGITGQIALADINEPTELKIYWKWQSFADDNHAIQDGLDGKFISSMLFDIILQGKQFKGVTPQEKLIMPSVDFIQPWSMAHFTQNQFLQYLQQISAFGYNQLILTELIEVELTGESYNNAITTVAYYDSAKTSNKVDMLKNLLLAIRTFNSSNPSKKFSVYLATAKEANWWNVSKHGYYSTAYLTGLANYEKEIMQELLLNYSSYSDIISGWYMWEELHSLSESIYPLDKHDQIKQSWINFTNMKISDIQSVGNNLPFVLSPFTNHTSIFTREILEKQWSDFFLSVNFRSFDIFAPQDSFSSLEEGYDTTYLVDRTLAAYVKGMQFAKIKPKFYINVEFFKAATMNNNLVNSSVATQRLIEQIEVANAYGAEKLCSFSFFHYYSTINGNDVSFESNYRKFFNENLAR